MLVANWRAVLLRAWSIRFLFFVGLFQGADIVIQITVGLSVEVSWGLRILAGFSAMAACIARLIPQKGLSDV